MCGSFNASTRVIKRSLLFISFCFLIVACVDREARRATPVTADSSRYLNHAPSARYVGMDQCRQCHEQIYSTFIKTGMGQSFDVASRAKSSAGFKRAALYDRFSDYHYRAFWDHDSLFINEFRIATGDTVHSRTEQVNYIIGSGQHTNSHLQAVNGYLNQMPMTYYTQVKKWDLPPGFENGVNTRFSRKVGAECITCHNAYPVMVMGSENKYTSIPAGIDCERCHGPGSVHVEERRTKEAIDTSRYIDYSIVNPAKLSINAQFDICQRCHLQGNAVLKNNKSFFDFRPGQSLSDFVSVFMPRYKNADDEFIMASHVERLKQSACFIKSLEKADLSKGLKPYQGAMTCVTCHNPHVSVRETGTEVFNNACLKCHNGGQNGKPGQQLIDQHKGVSVKQWNCVTCHMPLSGSIDIPHVTVHDHYIRRPVSRTEKKKIREFMGLYSVNEKKPEEITRVLAYLNQFAKFEQVPAYLDSAERILSSRRFQRNDASLFIQLFFMKQQYNAVIDAVKKAGVEYCQDTLFTKMSFDNSDAWSCYRVGESWQQLQNNHEALKWFGKAVKLAPFQPDFRNKYASALAAENKTKEAVREFESLISENPRFVPAYSNLGYLNLLAGRPAEALALYKKGYQLDPDNEALLLNLAGYYLFMNNSVKGRYYLNIVLKRDPLNRKAREILKQLGS